MGNIGSIIDGLEIIAAHVGRDDFISAEDDEIFAGDRPGPKTPEGEMLLELGWRWEEDLETWAMFV